MKPIFLAALLAGVFVTPCASSQDSASKPSIRYATPVFSQIVTFSVPSKFRPANEQNQNGQYLLESVPAGQTLFNWYEMITLTGTQGAVQKTGMSPADYLQNFASLYQKACPSSFSIKAYGQFSSNGHLAYAAAVGCGKNGKGSEKALIVVIKGASDFYTIQWAERGNAEEKASFDDAVWKGRLMQMTPIKVCDRVPGEKAPFPSCTNSTRSQ